MSYRALAEEALERAERATEGPWIAQAANRQHFLVWKHGYKGAGAICCLERESKYHFAKDTTSADADFLAHSRTDVPALAHAVLELAEENERLRADKASHMRNARNCWERCQIYEAALLEIGDLRRRLFSPTARRFRQIANDAWLGKRGATTEEREASDETA